MASYYMVPEVVDISQHPWQPSVDLLVNEGFAMPEISVTFKVSRSSTTMQWLLVQFKAVKYNGDRISSRTVSSRDTRNFDLAERDIPDGDRTGRVQTVSFDVVSCGSPRIHNAGWYIIRTKLILVREGFFGRFDRVLGETETDMFYVRDMSHGLG
jgi:hypothetical protein